MSRKYVKIDEHGKEILELKRAGKTNREISPMLDVDKECIRNWMFRFNRQQQKLAAGIKLRPKGRPRKDAQPRDIVAEQAYEINRTVGTATAAKICEPVSANWSRIHAQLSIYFAERMPD